MKCFQRVDNKLKWLLAILFALLVVVFIKTFVLWRVTASNQSMLPNVQDGETLLHFKLAAIEKGDLVVFRYQSKVDESGGESRYLKRLIGVSGDTVEIVNQNVTVNGSVEKDIEKLYDYHIQTNSTGLSQAQRDAYQLKLGGMIRAKELYKYSLSDEQALALEEEPNVEFVESTKYAKGIAGKSVAQFALEPKALGWNDDNFGPIVCPNKGMRIVLNDYHLNIYTSLLNRFEGKSLKKVDEFFYVNEVQADSVSFSKNYYFFLGDNRHQSIDSRHYGLIPAEKIEGSAFLLP